MQIVTVKASFLVFWKRISPIERPLSSSPISKSNLTLMRAISFHEHLNCLAISTFISKIDVLLLKLKLILFGTFGRLVTSLATITFTISPLIRQLWDRKFPIPRCSEISITSLRSFKQRRIRYSTTSLLRLFLLILNFSRCSEHFLKNSTVHCVWCSLRSSATFM